MARLPIGSTRYCISFNARNQRSQFVRGTVQRFSRLALNVISGTFGAASLCVIVRLCGREGRRLQTRECQFVWAQPRIFPASTAQHRYGALMTVSWATRTNKVPRIPGGLNDKQWGHTAESAATAHADAQCVSLQVVLLRRSLSKPRSVPFPATRAV